MKTSHTIIFSIAVMLMSCGDKKSNDNFDTVINSDDTAVLNSKKIALIEEQKALNDKVNAINSKLESLNGNEKLPLVSIITTKEENFNHFVELQGNVTTKNLVVINSEYAGMLQQVFVKEGQKVTKGQLLAKIDDGGLSQQLAQMQIQTELAKTTFERQQRLWEQSIGSEIQYLQAKSTYEIQEQAINQMQQQLAKTKVTAPFSGTIDDVITEQGSNIAPGTPLMRLVSLKDMYVEVDVPETYLSDITINKMVTIEFPILNLNLESKIRQASNFINAANRTYKIEVDIPENHPNIKPNLTAKLKINDYTNSNAILIPQDIISEDAQGNQYIYVVKNINDSIGTVSRTNVTTGKTQGAIIEILEGLAPDTFVIKEGARSVKEGQNVKVQQL